MIAAETPINTAIVEMISLAKKLQDANDIIVQTKHNNVLIKVRHDDEWQVLVNNYYEDLRTMMRERIRNLNSKGELEEEDFWSALEEKYGGSTISRLTIRAKMVEGGS